MELLDVRFFVVVTTVMAVTAMGSWLPSRLASKVFVLLPTSPRSGVSLSGAKMPLSFEVSE